jgi:quercetin dioxygenase-like cupin family protein
MVTIVRQALAAAVAGLLAVQAAPIRAQEEAVAYYDFTKTTGAPYGPFTEMRSVVTGSNSFAYATVPNGYHQPLHHHNQEQFTLGVEGALDYSIGGVVHRIGPHGVGLPPSNVRHGMSNDSGQPVRMVEFQAVRRAEWVPPHPQVPPQPQSPQPAALSPDQQVTLDFGLAASDWRAQPGGARMKVLSGKTIRATFWDLSAAGASVDLTAQPLTGERFVYVLDGALASVAGVSRREVGGKSLIVLTPAAKDVKLQSLGKAGTEIVVFDRIAAR